MNIRTSSRTAISTSTLALLLSTSGMPAMAKPAELQVPAQVSCIHKGKPAKGAWQVNRDGGIFVPRDPSAPPQLYSYVSDVGTSVKGM